MTTYQLAKRLKTKLTKVRPNTKATIKDIQKVIQAYSLNDFTQVFKTRLYNNYGRDYCELLEIICPNECKDY